MDSTASAEGTGRIVVLGDNSTVIGFKLAGIKRAYEVDEDVKDKLAEQMKHDDVNIIIINEYLLDKLPRRLRKRAEDSINPVIVPIPDKNMRESKSDSLKALIKRAIGFDLLGE